MESQGRKMLAYEGPDELDLVNLHKPAKVTNHLQNRQPKGVIKIKQDPHHVTRIYPSREYRPLQGNPGLEVAEKRMSPSKMKLEAALRGTTFTNVRSKSERAIQEQRPGSIASSIRTSS